MKNRAKDMLIDWLRTVDTAPNAESAANREKAIKKIIASDNQSLWLNIMRLAFGLKHQLNDGDFIGHFRKADETFPLSNNEHLLKVLANICLCYKLETGDSEINHWLALAIENCSFLSPLTGESNIPVFDYAAENLEVISRSSRKVDAHDLRDAIQQFDNDEPEENEASLDKKLMTSLLKVNVKLMEETDILWWLFTGYSKLLGKGFSEINKMALPIVAAKDLYDLMQIERVLESSTAFFKKVLGDGFEAETNVLEAVNNLQESERAQILGDNKTLISEFTPILKAIELSLGFPQGDDWSSAYKKQLGGDAKTPKLRHQVATQLYRELVFIWLCDDGGE